MISVVIPAYNEEKVIGKCLTAFAKQRTDREFEVILVNNASTDATKEIAREYEDRFNLRIIEEPTKGRGMARWRGANEASGNILLSTDADTIVPHDWIENMGKHFENPQVIAVTGAARIKDNNWFTNTGFNLGLYIVMYCYAIATGHFWFAGFNFGIRKEIYDQVGGFNKELNAAEDVDLSFKVSKIGDILFKNDITVTVSGRRLNNNLVGGFLSYSHAYASYIVHRKQHAYLSDVR